MAKTTKKTTTRAKTTKTRTAKSASTDKPETKTKPKLSAIDAAAKVLASSKEPLTAQQLIDAMTAKKLWTSPGGKTPHATLYSAILREIKTKGKESRFTKVERGKFAVKK